MPELPELPEPGHLGDLLSALLDGELEPASAAAAREHVDTCPACRAELDATAAARRLLRDLPELDAPFGLVQRAPRRDRQLAWIAAAAAASAVLLLVSSAPSDPGSGPLARLAGLATNPTELGFEDAGVIEGGLQPPYHAPTRLAEGYTRVGLYDRGRVVQIVYSNGVHTLSVFEQAGHVGRDDLPTAPSSTVRMEGGQGWALDLAEAQVVTWQAGPLVYAAIGDAPLGEVVLAAVSFSRPRPLSAGQRVPRGARTLVDVVSGRR